jgi:hypothetical protein
MNRVLWYIGRRRPLLFLGIPGMLTLAAGLVVGVFVVNVVMQRHATPISTALISVFLCIGGAMTVYAGLILSTIGKLEAALQSKAAIGALASSSPAWPLLFFGIPGMLGLMADLAWGIRAVGTFVMGRGLLPGSYIGSGALCVGSLVTWLTGIVLHALHDILVGAGQVQAS